MATSMRSALLRVRTPSQTCRRRNSIKIGHKQQISCRAQSNQEFNWATFNLDNAALEYLEGLERGESEEDLVARQLGAPRFSDLTELQEKYADKVKEKLVERAVQIRQERLKASRAYERGRAAYESGDYFAAVELLERAVKDIGKMSLVGGEAQLWLALAYQAVGREEDGINVYKDLEKNHPTKKIRKQAENLRFIMEAPKLKLGEDEKVQIPLLDDSDSKWGSSSRYSKPVAKSGGASVPKSYLDDLLDMPAPEMNGKNRYVIVAWTVLLLGVAIYVNYKHGLGEL